MGLFEEVFGLSGLYSSPNQLEVMQSSQGQFNLLAQSQAQGLSQQQAMAQAQMQALQQYRYPPQRRKQNPIPPRPYPLQWRKPEDRVL